MDKDRRMHKNTASVLKRATIPYQNHQDYSLESYGYSTRVPLKGH